MAAKGRNILIKVLIGNTYTTIAGMRTKRMKLFRGTQEIEQDEYIWRRLLDNNDSKASISGECIFMNDAAAKLVHDLAENGQANMFKIEYENGDSFRASFVTTLFEYTMSSKEAVTANISLESAGAGNVDRAQPVGYCDYVDGFTFVNTAPADLTPALIEPHGIAYDILTNVWIVVGHGTKYLYSIDEGNSWEYRDVLDTDWQDIISDGAGNWVICCDRGEVYKSSDGLNWTVQELTPNDRLDDIQYGNGVFVTVGFHQIQVSSDGANTWTYIPTTRDYAGICTDGEGTWVAVSTDGYQSKSIDNGVTWVESAVTPLYSLYGICFGDGLWVVVGQDGYIGTSPTGGPTWTERSPPVETHNMNDVRYVSSFGYMAVSQFSSYHTSDDGITWSEDKLIPDGSSTLSFIGNSPGCLMVIDHGGAVCKVEGL